MEKNKVIVYGVYSIELRRKIENFLEDEYIIIGYTDSYHEKDILDGKAFIKRDNLKDMDFDFIIISIGSIEICRHIREELCLEGIRREKIVIPYILLNKNYICQKDLLAHIQNNLSSKIETIILGLSYSLRGVDKARLKTKAFDFSWQGLDIYYNNELLKWSKKNGYLSSCKQAILVFAYDAINRDMSFESYQYETGQILSVSQLHDWHNGYKISDGIVEEYINGIEMFGRKFLNYYKFSENIYDHNVLDAKQQVCLGHTWIKCHDETIAANKKCFDELICEIKEITDRIITIVPPYCMNAIDTDIDIIEKNRKEYYECVNNYDIEIYDLLYKWRDKREYFSDATHLNYEGAKHFTDFINEIL